jgi:peptidoglycan/xylan/chitin deacetylase (PgdA/CDA1 family)
MGAIWDWARTAVSERVTRNWPAHALFNRAAEPLVTFTFDDFPRSAATVGARILADFNVKGTYFVSGSRAGRHLDGMDQFTEDDLLAVAEAGHEIGCHTFGHIRLPISSPQQIEDDLSRNREFVNRILGGYRMTSFAYPHGHASIAAKNLIWRHFPVARGIWFGVNKRRVDFAQLRAVSLEQSFERRTEVLDALDEAQESNGWVLFFTHDVSETPSRYGCTPGDLARILEAVLDRGIDVLPMKAAAAKVRFSQECENLW